MLCIPIVGDRDPEKHVAEAYARILATLHVYKDATVDDVKEFESLIAGIHLAVAFLKGDTSKEDMIKEIMKSYSPEVLNMHEYLKEIGFHLDVEGFLEWSKDPGKKEQAKFI